MRLRDYQAGAARTLAERDDRARLITALGLCGEAGEVAELLKKSHGHGHGLSLEQLAKELGNTLWYLAALATLHGLELDAVAEGNLAKLRQRYPDGFSPAASQARADLHGLARREAGAWDANGTEVEP